MKKFAILAVAAAMTVGTLDLSAQSEQNQITDAMMRAYEKVIRENPNDFEPYYRRAAEYYRTNQYLRALQDINRAIELTPATEADMRFAEYVLRANIYDNTGETAKALEDINAAISLEPTNYVSVYQKANIEFQLGKLDEAKASYRKLQSINPRSLEALFGLARIAVKEKDYAKANELADKAVEANPSQIDAYVRRASVRASMGNNTGAVDDLILALSTDHADTHAVRDLVAMGTTDYAATITGLTKAISQAPKVGMFRYIRAMIEQAHYRYKDAIEDFRFLIDQNLYDYPGIYASLSECEYALGQYAQASTDIEYAIGATQDNGQYYIQLAKVRRAQWRTEEALEAINKAIVRDASNNDALLEKALILVDLKRYDEASDIIGEAILNDSESALYLLTRGWILSEYLKQGGNAKIYYRRVLDLPSDTPESLTGFAYLFNGEQAEGAAWITGMLANNQDPDGRLNYLAACFYAQAGDTDTALQHMERSLANGYANYHDWTQADDARISVAPIRDNPKFNQLLSKFKSLF